MTGKNVSDMSDDEIRAMAGATDRLTMAEFRELTSDVPGDWGIEWVVQTGDNRFSHHHAEASVNLTEHCVEVSCG